VLGTRPGQQRESNVPFQVTGDICSGNMAVASLRGSYSSLKQRGCVKGGASWGFAG